MYSSFYQTLKNILQNTSVLELPTAVSDRVMLANGVFVSVFLVAFQPFRLDRSGIGDLLLVALSTGVLIFVVHAVVIRLARHWMSERHFTRAQIFGLEFSVTGAVILLVALAVFIIRASLNKVPFSIETGLLFLSYGLMLAPILVAINRTVIVVRVMLSVLTKAERAVATEEGADAGAKELIISGSSDKETVQIRLGDFLFARAEGNYVNITLYKDSRLTSALLRCTFASFVEQTRSVPHLIRCHRSYLVNMHKVTQLVTENQSKSLRLIDADIFIPVSRANAKAVSASYHLMMASR